MVLKMARKPDKYRLCSCGAKFSPRSTVSIRKHRKMGHTIPMQKYDFETGEKVKPRP